MTAGGDKCTQSENKYISSWNTQEANAGNGDHEIFFRAIDKSGNEKKTKVNLTVFNEGDVTYPSLKLIFPKKKYTILEYKSKLKPKILKELKALNI